MNKKTLVTFLILAVLVVFGFGSCASSSAVDDAHNSRNSLDWEGVYTGTIPAADCPGINVRLTLNKDQSFVLLYEYIDRPDSNNNSTGSFKWDKKGNIVILDIKNTPPYYKVAENKLIQLDMKGKPISGDLADNYVLKKSL